MTPLSCSSIFSSHQPQSSPTGVGTCSTDSQIGAPQDLPNHCIASRSDVDFPSLGFSPGLLGKNAAVGKRGLSQMGIDHVRHDSLILSIAVPREILAHPRRQFWIIGTARSIDLGEAD